METQTVIGILSALGVGGLLGVFAKSFLDKQHHKFSRVFEFKEARYKAIMILMWVAMKPTEFELNKLRSRRPDIKNVKDLDAELNLEYYNAMLFASGEVLDEMAKFLENKNIDNWKSVARSVRKDLFL